MHIFTSITTNYLPKARVLACSVKRTNPDARFHVLLSDRQPEGFDLNSEPFDSVININDLDIPNRSSWIFKHSLVELCTAVKGMGFQFIFERYNADSVIYFDPDIAVFSSLASLREKLTRSSVLLTPHQTVPETDYGAVVDNEICSLKHGVYNLGFLAIRNSLEGRKFLNWWSKRLYHFCYDDIAGGLFTDQRWIDLAPAFFEDLHILREPIYNVSTWNLSHRTVQGNLESGLTVNGVPLCFYHFSGLDSGAQEVMLNKYLGKSFVLKDLRAWYLDECCKRGQMQLGKTPSIYDTYRNGEKIEKHERVLYRSRQDLESAFPDPFDTWDVDRSYFHWYKSNVADYSSKKSQGQETLESLRTQLAESRRELQLIKRSRGWRIVRNISVLRSRFPLNIP